MESIMHIVGTKNVKRVPHSNNEQNEKRDRREEIWEVRQIDGKRMKHMRQHRHTHTHTLIITTIIAITIWKDVYSQEWEQVNKGVNEMELRWFALCVIFIAIVLLLCVPARARDNTHNARILKHKIIELHWKC